VNSGWQDRNGPGYFRPEQNHHNLARMLNGNRGSINRFKGASSKNFAVIPEPLNANHNYMIQSGLENSRICFQSQRHDLNSQDTSPEVSENHIKLPH